ncbi:MAG TPA: serine hydrolase domain-containing protein [Candidatus Sulfotelmatobacter sp.]|nr:serine hydrolase domain-containing protein [Candidatus Sulfotelmatobacter sp.]
MSAEHPALSKASTLVPAWDDQERAFSAAFDVLHNAIDQRAFPAASIAVTHHGCLVALKAFGRFTFDAGSPQPTPAILFDLASLTKAVATTSMAMILYERGLLELEAPVIGILPEFAGQSDPRRASVTFRMLLAHSSGLPAYEKLFLRAHTREDLLQATFTTSLSADPGTRAEYSDLGFILLATALERIAGESLDLFCQHEIFGPLAMTHTTFNPPAGARAAIPPTADDRTFRHKIIQGEVQDENAYVLGGVAGHAGLFSTAEDLARFAHVLLQCGAGTPARVPILRPETVALFTRRESEPPGTSRALGWDTPSSPSQSGKYFAHGSYGHLGYTGTSLWIDPSRQLSITLLTNRTWPDCANQAIKQLRPKFHDAISEALHA